MLHVREATIDDMTQLGRIMAVSFRSAFSGFISRETLDICAREDDCAQLLQGLFEAGKMRFLAGELDGKLCGMLVWEGNQIQAIHSVPESWGTGLGAAMLNSALARMGRPVELWAFKENKRARRFYEKHGLRFTGEERTSEFDGAQEVRYLLEY